MRLDSTESEAHKLHFKAQRNEVRSPETHKPGSHQSFGRTETSSLKMATSKENSVSIEDWILGADLVFLQASPDWTEEDAFFEVLGVLPHKFCRMARCYPTLDKYFSQTWRYLRQVLVQTYGGIEPDPPDGTTQKHRIFERQPSIAPKLTMVKFGAATAAVNRSTASIYG